KSIEDNPLEIFFLSPGVRESLGGGSPSKNIYYRAPNEMNRHLLGWGRFAWSPEDPGVAEDPLDTSELKSVMMQEVQNGVIDLSDSLTLVNQRDHLNPMGHNYFPLTAMRGEIESGLRT